MQEARNLFVPKAPRHVTTLARFTALRYVSLLGAESLLPMQVRCVPMQFCTAQKPSNCLVRPAEHISGANEMYT